MPALVARTKAMKIGNPLNEDTTVGATISRAHAEKVLSYVDGAKQAVHARSVLVCFWLVVSRCASGCVVECQSCNRFEFRPGLLHTKVYSAFHPSGVSKVVPAVAGKAKAGMAHSAC